MPNVKQYTAKRAMKMDCGHTVKEGESFLVFSAFTCSRDCKWPLRILWAYSAPLLDKPAQRPSSPSPSAPAPETKATPTSRPSDQSAR
jgi:hypothetical protein